MNPRICICCAGPIGPRNSALYCNPNLCAECSTMEDRPLLTSSFKDILSCERIADFDEKLPCVRQNPLVFCAGAPAIARLFLMVCVRRRYVNQAATPLHERTALAA